MKAGMAVPRDSRKALPDEPSKERTGVRLTSRTLRQTDSPIGVTYALLDERAGSRELLDLAQAAPQYPAAPSVVQHVVSVARDAHGADYVDLAGLPRLRTAFADELSRDYRGRVGEENVVVMPGATRRSV